MSLRNTTIKNLNCSNCGSGNTKLGLIAGSRWRSCSYRRRATPAGPPGRTRLSFPHQTGLAAHVWDRISRAKVNFNSTEPRRNLVSNLSPTLLTSRWLQTDADALFLRDDRDRERRTFLLVRGRAARIYIFMRREILTVHRTE